MGGWAPTAIGYSAQGLCKFGFYEVFKNIYSGILGEENSYLYRTSLYLAASASAEFFADIALSPMESVKVRIQTSPAGTFPTTPQEEAGRATELRNRCRGNIRHHFSAPQFGQFQRRPRKRKAPATTATCILLGSKARPMIQL